MNRRELLKNAAGIAITTALAPNRLTASRHPSGLNPLEMASTEASRLALDPRRPQYHLLPARNWMNDPNGPIFWNGQYHMFYQYNPTAAVWGDMHWAHAISPDTVHWKHLPIALSPTPGGPDAAGCFSGTAAVEQGVVTMLYTGVVQAPENQATIRDGVHSLRESQCLATSTDPQLRSWSKLPSPVIAAPPAGLQVTGFRDPSPWRKGDWWYMTIGSGIPRQGGAVFLYRSKNLRHWEYLHFVASGTGWGRETQNPVNSGDMWECPELFPLGGRHVLIYSAQGKVFWQSGVLDEVTMLFHPDQHGILDYGSYYAAKTQLDQHGNRILWGWIQETRSVAEYRAAGWAGMMSVPRVLSLDIDGRLRIEISPAMHALRRRPQVFKLEANELASPRHLSELSIENCCGEILCRIQRSSEPFTLSLIGKLPQGEISEPLVRLQFDPKTPQQILADGKPIPISGPNQDQLELHVYVDGSVAEIIINRAVAYTKRFYYPGSQPPRVSLRAESEQLSAIELSAWQLAPISSNRLTG